MQGERSILGYLEAMNFELGSTSSDGVTDPWDNIHNDDLHDFMIANSEQSHEQHGSHRLSLGEEASSSGTKNEASSSHSEQRRNEIIDLDSDSEQPSAPNQHVQNVNEESSVSTPPVSRNMLPPFQWTDVSSTSTVPVERDLHLDDETRPRSIPESPLFIPPPELRSSRNATSGNMNLASSVSRTGVQPPSYQNLPHQQRRRSELAARRSLIPSLAGSGDHPLAPPTPTDGLVLPPGGDNSQMPYSRGGIRLDRQGDGVAGTPHSFRALAATSRGRSRLTGYQMHNILDVMRRDPNHNLRLEDIMLLNPSLLFDGVAAGMHDRYRDMRLDVDNMSYEELLALEERIGDVCTGVNEETISNRLKKRKFKSSTKSPQDFAEPCCICQEEYNEGEDMGTLECGHDFHSQCIKEWLKQKNLCPICKTTGLNTAKKRKIG